ncbi:MAG TPA: nitrous oxide reductase accessory protein NosL [Gemmatimonadales bacterium]|nr:nitrous oxide reductase accessory protein NosL [Gemmatimonadales bacterium]
MSLGPGCAWSALAAAALLGCAQPAPRAIAYGEEPCRHCHMTIVDPRFAAELVTATGKVYVFDDVGCLTAFVHDGEVPPSKVHGLWVYDYLQPDSLLDARQAVYLRVDSLATPMGSHLAALRAGPAADSLRARLGGTLLTWEQLPTGRHDG